MNLRVIFPEKESPRSMGAIVRVTLTSAAAIALALGCLGAAAPQAQNTPGMRSSQMDGDWLNVDPHTRGLVEVVIAGNKIHPYGSCHPAACDWGVIKAKSFASSVQSADMVRLVAKKNTDFNHVELTLSLEGDGRLRVESFTHFTDSSGRADYSDVNYFARGRRAYLP